LQIPKREEREGKRDLNYWRRKNIEKMKNISIAN
jgi:hypothetical protein